MSIVSQEKRQELCEMVRDFVIIDFEAYFTTTDKVAPSEYAVVNFCISKGLRSKICGFIEKPLSISPQEAKQAAYITTYVAPVPTYASMEFEHEAAEKILSFLKVHSPIIYAKGPALEQKLFKQWSQNYNPDFAAYEIRDVAQLWKGVCSSHGSIQRDLKSYDIDTCLELWRNHAKWKCKDHRYHNMRTVSGHCALQDCMIAGYCMLMSVLKIMRASGEDSSYDWEHELPLVHSIRTGDETDELVVDEGVEVLKDLVRPLLLAMDSAGDCQGYYADENGTIKAANAEAVMFAAKAVYLDDAETAPYAFLTGYFSERRFVSSKIKSSVQHLFSTAVWNGKKLAWVYKKMFPSPQHFRNPKSIPTKIMQNSIGSYILDKDGNSYDEEGNVTAAHLGLIEMFFNN